MNVRNIIKLFLIIILISLNIFANEENYLNYHGNKFISNKKKSTYLLLVTFKSTSFNRIEKEFLNSQKSLPYDGIAVMMHDLYGRYDKGEYFRIMSVAKKIQKESKKELWPWVFCNHFIGGDLSEIAQTKISKSDIEYFKRIPGMDIYNQTGALNDFMHAFRDALKLAKELNSPGIVIDNEPYNNRKTNGYQYLTDCLGKSKKNIKSHLNNIGKELSNIVEEEYPTAVLWYLSTRRKLVPGQIVKGILDEAMRKSIPLKVIEGGQNEIGYVQINIESMNKKILDRQKEYLDIRKKYRNHIYLGGTIAPTDTPNSRSGWIKREYAKTEIKGVEDLKPFFVLLFKNYEYVWIYAAGAANYNPFEETSSKVYDNVIRESIKLNFIN